MRPHGSDKQAFEHASNGVLEPVKHAGPMASMFGARFPQRMTKYAAELPTLQENDIDC